MRLNTFKITEQKDNRYTFWRQQSERLLHLVVLHKPDFTVPRSFSAPVTWHMKRMILEKYGRDEKDGLFDITKSLPSEIFIGMHLFRVGTYVLVRQTCPKPRCFFGLWIFYNKTSYLWLWSYQMEWKIEMTI